MSKIPFSLDSISVDYHFVEIYPALEKCLALTKAKSLASATKLFASLQPNEDETKWGLKLPKNNGLLVAERMSLKDTANRKKAIAEYLSLMARIHDETGIPIKDLQVYFSEPFKYTDKLGNYLGDISSVFNKLDESNDLTGLVTVMIRERLIPTWTDQDTGALHEDIYNAIVEYSEKEQASWEEPTADDAREDEPLPGEAGESSLDEEPKNSETTETSTGETSTTTSLAGV